MHLVWQKSHGKWVHGIEIFPPWRFSHIGGRFPSFSLPPLVTPLSHHFPASHFRLQPNQLTQVHPIRGKGNRMAKLSQGSILPTQTGWMGSSISFILAKTKCCHLEATLREAEDQRYAELLSGVRLRCPTDQDLDLLTSINTTSARSNSSSSTDSISRAQTSPSCPSIGSIGS